MLIEYIFCFICSKQCIKFISSRKKCGLFSSVCKVVVDSNLQVRVVFRISKSCKYQQQLSQFYNFIKSSYGQLKYF